MIDVIRAFTFAHYAFLGGARRILLADSEETAFALKQRYSGYMLAGERNGLYIPGFDLDNSPHHAREADLKGRTLVQKTTNGVRSALHTAGADRLYVTGFANARVTAEHVRAAVQSAGWGGSTTIQLVASHPAGDDDLACAEYIRDLLSGGRQASDSALTRERIRSCEAARKFYDAARPEFLEEDMELCLKERSDGFVMEVKPMLRIPMIVKVETRCTAD